MSRVPCWILVAVVCRMRVEGQWTPMKHLHRDLLERKQYNKNVRPVFNHSDLVDVMIGLKFSQLIDLVCHVTEMNGAWWRHDTDALSAWASYQIRKIAGCACAGNPGKVFPPPRVSDPDMHHGTCMTHVPWCMPGSLTSGFLWSRCRGIRSLHSRRMRNRQFCVSGKRPIADPLGGESLVISPLNSSPPGQNGRHFANNIFRCIFVN